MTDPSFPFPAIGLVHIYNRITQHRAIRSSERLQIDVWATPVEEHPRGKQFSLRTEVTAGDELVWEEISTNLKRGGGSEAAKAPGTELPRAEDLPATATWDLPGDLGRRYGSVSGDLNPIHVHPLSARLFGFPSAIAHGMWTKARCLAAIESRLPEAFTVEVAFKKPILLPGKVEFCEADGARRGCSTSSSGCATRARAARIWTGSPSAADPPYANRPWPTNPPGAAPGGQAKIALPMCAVCSFSRSLSASLVCIGMNWARGSRWKQMNSCPPPTAPS